MNKKELLAYLAAKPILFSTDMGQHIRKKDKGAYGWDKNPCVWVYEFEKVEVDKNEKMLLDLL